MRARIANQQNQQGQQLFGTLMPQYEGMLNRPGFSDVEKAGITEATLGGAGARYDAAREAAGNRVARTRNDAGYAEQEDELARSQGRTAAEAGGALQAGFADRARADRSEALRGVQGLYGIDEETMARLLQVAAPRQQGGFLNSLIGSGGTIGAAAISA